MSGETIHLKCVLLGETAVGKSCLISRFVNDVFQTNHISTLAGTFSSKTVFYDKLKKKIKYEIWDTAGQEKYKSITRNLFLKVMGAIILYDITNEKSFSVLKDWVKLIKEECGSHMQIIIVGNKCDIEDQRKVNQDDAINFAKENNYEYIETSCMTGENVEKTVKTLCEKILDNNDLGVDVSFRLDTSSFMAPKKKKCC